MEHQGSARLDQACTFHSSRLNPFFARLSEPDNSRPLSCGLWVRHYRIKASSDFSFPIFSRDVLRDARILDLKIAQEVSDLALTLAVVKCLVYGSKGHVSSFSLA